MWTEILTSLLGGTSVVSVFFAERYRKQNKALKDISVKKNDNEEQAERIDLGEKYLEKVMSLTERNFDAINRGNTALIEKFETIDAKICNIEEYLNGDFKVFMKRKNGERKRPETR